MARKQPKKQLPPKASAQAQATIWVERRKIDFRIDVVMFFHKWTDIHSFVWLDTDTFESIFGRVPPLGSRSELLVQSLEAVRVLRLVDA